MSIAIMTPTRPLLFLLIVSLSATSTSAFAVSSSQSPKKRQISNDRNSGGGGFGKTSETPAPTSHARDNSPEISRLVDFLAGFKSEGLAGPNPGTEIGSSLTTGRRGCYALKNHKKGDILCRVPSDCALALSDPRQIGDLDQTFAEGGRNFLQWYADNDKARGMWEPYLDSLPKLGDNFDPTPDFFSDEEIAALEFPLAVRLAVEKQAQVAQLAQKEGLSPDALRFAAWIVSSRAFVININIGGGDDGALKAGPDGGSDAVAARSKSLRVLIPYLDMINHSSDNANAELHLIDPEKDEAWFAIRATRPIKAGKEVTISYGTGFESSVELLNNYGFVADENRVDGRMLEKGSDEMIQDLDGWNTSLEEDRRALEEGGDSLGNMETVLRFRIKLKESYSGKD